MSRKNRGLYLSFAISVMLFAALMSLPFLVPGLGFLSLFGFVPLLVMDALADTRGVKGFWIWYFSAFLLWNVCTTFWVCNATLGGGIFACVANAFQMTVIFALFRFSKKFLGNFFPYVFLVLMWIAWERLYFSAEISWPWLTLGNAFASSVRDIQWYEFTGSLGGSLWIWLCNISLFFLVLFILGGYFRDMVFIAKTFLCLFCITVVGCPIFLSRKIYDNYEEVSSGKLKVLIGQPNIDPYQKFKAMPQATQTGILLDLFAEGLRGHENERILLLAPETFTNDIQVGFEQQSTTMRTFREFLTEYPYADLLFGSSSFEYVQSEEAPSYTARFVRDGLWVESHNSALITDSTARHEIFHKSRLVVGTEKTPYPKLFTRIDDKLGGVMGRCSGQDEISLLHTQNGIPIGCAICYESVYGEYCTGYVKKGAKALTVITNDAWWGDTPGYRQHLSYSSLRAIETRRDIARCANTGISAFINQRGDIVSETSWWKRDTLTGYLNLSDRKTFYVEHGDITGKVCTCLFLIMLAVVLLRLLINKK